MTDLQTERDINRRSWLQSIFILVDPVNMFYYTCSQFYSPLDTGGDIYSVAYPDPGNLVGSGSSFW